MLQKCSGTLPQICASTKSCLRALRTIPSTSWLGFWSDMQSTVGPYIDMGVPFQIMSNQLNLPQIESNQVVETSRMINGNRMHLSSISSLIAKGLNAYVNKVFLFICKNLFFHFVIMGYCDVIMVYCDVINY